MHIHINIDYNEKLSYLEKNTDLDPTNNCSSKETKAMSGKAGPHQGSSIRLKGTTVHLDLNTEVNP